MIERKVYLVDDLLNESITIYQENPGEIEIAPTIYVEELYEEYFKSPDFNRIVKESEEMLHTEFPINYNLRNLHPDEMKKHTERDVYKRQS